MQAHFKVCHSMTWDGRQIINLCMKCDKNAIKHLERRPVKKWRTKWHFIGFLPLCPCEISLTHVDSVVHSKAQKTYMHTYQPTIAQISNDIKMCLKLNLQKRLIKIEVNILFSSTRYKNLLSHKNKLIILLSHIKQIHSLQHQKTIDRCM